MATTSSTIRTDALLMWRKETTLRQQAISNAERVDGESMEAFELRKAALPQPRSFNQYCLDPNNDGAVTSPDSTAFAFLDEDDPRNADALYLKPEFFVRSPGVDQDAVEFYRMAMEDLSGKGWKTIPSRAYERIYPQAVTRTSTADFIPDAFNLFTKNDGTRIYAHEVGDGAFSIKRVGFNLINGPVGLGLLLGVALIGTTIVGKTSKTFLKLMPTTIDTVGKSVKEGIEGVGEITAGIFEAKNEIEDEIQEAEFTVIEDDDDQLLLPSGQVE